MRIINNSIPIEAIVLLAIATAGCDSRVPTQSTPSIPDLPVAGVAQHLTAGDTEEQNPDDSVDSPTCTVIDVKQLRVERVEGLYVTIRALADTAAEGRLYARVWLDERHTVRLGDFDLERGELTLFTVLLPPPGPPAQLYVDVELEDSSGHVIQCDRSLKVEG